MKSETVSPVSLFIETFTAVSPVSFMYKYTIWVCSPLEFQNFKDEIIEEWWGVFGLVMKYQFQ